MSGHGRTVIITGGGRGIGAATARLAAQHGWDVVVSYRKRPESAQRVAAECERAGARSLAVGADVTVETDVKRLFEAATALPGSLRGLVNNAGAVAPLARLEEFTVERVEHTFAVNLTGAFICAREAVRRMSTRHGGQGGAIVNVSSRAAVLGSPEEYVDYAAAKAGVDALTVGLSKEVATDGIRVVAVRPGLIDTELHAPGRLERLGASPPLGRPGTAHE
ncbi:MAG TPA: SDR family NAD(P)-dependent oxidoreductase, partial [Micromonosporaceae bacterium]|nr:SDR family NAD(P)-dependent oxidoreductase [Micromonosporaceae bacterium]